MVLGREHVSLEKCRSNDFSKTKSWLIIVPDLCDYRLRI